MIEKRMQGLKKALPSLIAIAIGLVVGVFIIYFTNPQAAKEAIPKFFQGPFIRGTASFGDLFYHSLSILMTGLAVGFAYQTGLFNIGASGQFLIGGFVTILFAAKMKKVLPKEVIWIFAMLLAALAGGLYAAIVGALKAYRNVNEVITCIMLNYTALYAVNDLIKRTGIYNQMKNKTVDISAQLPRLGIDKIFPGTFASGGIFIAIGIVIILHIILHKSIFGFEIKGVGLNRHAAKYAGINENRSIILSMAISGMLAALGGSMLYLSGAGNSISVQEVLPQEGFDGIAVALLGLSEPIGILLSAIFVAFLLMGGQAIQTLGYAPELITMIISFILYVSALSVLFRRLLVTRRKEFINE